MVCNIFPPKSPQSTRKTRYSASYVADLRLVKTDRIFLSCAHLVGVRVAAAVVIVTSDDNCPGDVA